MQFAYRFLWALRGGFFVFFFNDTATPEIYTLSLHDALPIYRVTRVAPDSGQRWTTYAAGVLGFSFCSVDRKSTRLNSSHLVISYAVFCLKKKKKKKTIKTKKKKKNKYKKK